MRLPEIYSRDLMALVFEQLYSPICNLVEKGVAQRQAASRYRYDLTDLGALREMQLG